MVDHTPAVERAVQLRSVEEFAQVHDLVQTFANEIATSTDFVIDSTWRMQLLTAVVEITANSVIHAYHRALPPGKIHVWLKLVDDVVEGTVEDEGFEFDADGIVHPPQIEGVPDLKLIPEHGRGLALASACVDSLVYERAPEGRNRWLLRKRLLSAPIRDATEDDSRQ